MTKNMKFKNIKKGLNEAIKISSGKSEGRRQCVTIDDKMDLNKTVEKVSQRGSAIFDDEETNPT